MRRQGSTISRASLMGMVAVSWISILLIGGAWIASLYYEFRVESDRLRDEHYAAQRDIVRSETERGVGIVEKIREARLEAMQQDLEDRIGAARRLSRVLSHLAGDSASGASIGHGVVRFLDAKSDDARLYAVHRGTVYLISPFPQWYDRHEVLTQLDDALKRVDSGRHRVSLDGGGEKEPCVVTVTVQVFDDPALRVVAGACVEVVEDTIKQVAISTLESVQYAKGGTLFGGTMDGDSLFGPAKGKNMWEATDVNGVKIVQELVKAAKAGGGFVNYVMPQFEETRATAKVSYAMPVPDWGWYIGTGTYVDDIEAVIDMNRDELGREILLRAGGILAGLGLLSLVSMAIAHRLSRNIRANLETFTEVWNQASTRGRTIDSKALRYGEFVRLADAANKMAEDRLEAQMALEASLERFSTLVSNIPGMVYRSEKGSVWRNLYISDYCHEMTGYPAEEFMGDEGRSFNEIVHPDDRKWVMATFVGDVRENQPYHADYRIVRKDGQVRWLSERGMPRTDEQGEVRWIDGVIFDVTDRKKAEEEYFTHIHFLETLERVDRALHQAENINSMLTETLDVIRQTFGADRAWLLCPADPEAESYRVPYESTVSEFPGANAGDMEIPFDEETRVVIRTALASPDPVAFGPQSEHELPADAAVLFNVRSQLVFAVRPRVGKPWLAGMHQCREERQWSPDDIRLFKEVGRRLGDAVSAALILDELRDSEAMFRTFSEQTLLGLCVLQDNKVIFANKAYADIFETTVEDMKAMPPGGFVKYIHPDDLEFAMEQARKKQAGEAGVVSSYKWRAVTETGRVRWVEIHSKSAQVGDRYADLISLVDITEAKRAEEDMEALIAERTTDLAHKAEELKRANAHLMKLDELKSAFLSTVSHTMRTPLTSVIGFTKLVKGDLQNILDTADVLDLRHSRVLRNLGIMESEGKRLTRLIDQFIELTALEADSDLRTEEPHSITRCIGREADRVRSMIEGNPKLHLVLDVDDELPVMHVSPDRFEQMLGAILDNAVTYTREGTITVSAQSPDGKGLELVIADTGKGIPEDELEAIFDAFHQVETGDTLVDEVKGVGLGLALCRMIAERMGGTVRAKSSLGKGAAFHISLPGDMMA